MSELETAAQEFTSAVDAVLKAAEKYYAAARAVGEAAPDGATYRGFDGNQVRTRLQSELIARLSPRRAHGGPKPLFQFDGAPEARRFAKTHPLLRV
jgi:hypothetical protein